jgi:AcrR family transcriptional regulator
MSSMGGHESGSRQWDGGRLVGRKPRTDGVESRRTILLAAANLATTRGLEGLSIGELAQHIGMSKSGLYAHFKSKEASGKRRSSASPATNRTSRCSAAARIRPRSSNAGT